MKALSAARTLAMALAAMAVIGSAAAQAGPNPGTGIRGTRHDLSSTGPLGADLGDEMDRICVYCHAPHNTVTRSEAATRGIGYTPLWNHTLSTIPVYQTYSSGPDTPEDVASQTNAGPAGFQPGGVSKLCLSCHDGSVAVNAYGSRGIGTLSPRFIGSLNSAGGLGAAAEIGREGNLANHHPIGFSYASAQAVDDELAPAETIVAQGATINDLLWQGRLECPTCHDVHNTRCEGERLLWRSDRQSAFCLTCHLKGS